MKKWLIFFSTFLFAIVVSFTSYLYLYRAEFTAQALSRLYGTPVQIANIRVTGKDIELQRLVLYNPPEYTMQPALTIKRVMLKMTPLQAVGYFFGITPNIRRIEIIDSTIAIDETHPETNWNTFLSNLKPHTASTSHLCVVKSIILRDTSFQIKNKSLHQHTEKLPSIYEIEIELPNAPLTPETIIYEITKQTLKSAC
ncbi:MAG: hypothetical protein JSR37_03965 [Verrucomicrobia bacterium]|nr:hypothetical protein [Verrucomicrobiota bacterium]MBS0637185.1 hypothetical protein [Verrucomicrobiota bacterium]